jgi:phytoene/squalene synthetase
MLLCDRVYAVLYLQHQLHASLHLPLMQQAKLWLRASLTPDRALALATPDSADRLRDVLASAAMMARGSKSFTMASHLFAWPTRADIQGVYAFCRITDDIADDDDNGMGVAERSRRLARIQAALLQAPEHLDLADRPPASTATPGPPPPMPTADSSVSEPTTSGAQVSETRASPRQPRNRRGGTAANALDDTSGRRLANRGEEINAPVNFSAATATTTIEKHGVSKGDHDQGLTPLEKMAVRCAVRAQVHCGVPVAPFLGLLRGYARDLSGEPITSEADLVEYARLVAGTVGEMVTHVMLAAHTGCPRWASALVASSTGGRSASLAQSQPASLLPPSSCCLFGIHVLAWSSWLSAASSVLPFLSRHRVLLQPVDGAVVSATELERAILAPACTMGIGMQLLNVARDLITDAKLGRLYAPPSYLVPSNASPLPHVSDPSGQGAWRQALVWRMASEDLSPADHRALHACAADLVALAQAHLDVAISEGAPQLPPTVRPAVLAAARVYGGIGQVLKARRLRGEPYPARAVVPAARKLWEVLVAVYV